MLFRAVVRRGRSLFRGHYGWFLLLITVTLWSSSFTLQKSPYRRGGLSSLDRRESDALDGPVVPEGVKVVALVFYGRKEFVQILDCYLKKNLKENGGLLDEVILASRTSNQDDIDYLEELLQTSPRYSKYLSTTKYAADASPIASSASGPYAQGVGTWLDGWEPVTEPDNIYIKIDDDVLFIEDNTISALVQRILESPEYFAVSANVVNSPALSWVHYAMGVYEPYWPEMTPSESIATPDSGKRSPISWRSSDLPSYEGPPGGPIGFDLEGTSPAPYQGHRWLPVRTTHNQSKEILLSPASTLTYDIWGPGRMNWAAAAQTHYSFLQHLEQGDIWRYRFNTWDFSYTRVSINFLAIRGKDVIDAFPFPMHDDEEYLTVVRPRELGRHVIVDGAATVAHFAFGPQRDTHDGKSLMWTDLLDRYQAYADEIVCPFV